MLRKNLRLPLLLLTFITFLWVPASADIIVSGDSSIGFSTTGTITGGNAVFFSNVLGNGHNVLIQDPDTSPGNGNVPTTIETYYNSLPGVTATLTTSPSVIDLSGVNLFINMLPQAAYTNEELNAMASFVNNGGTLFMIGEAVDYPPGGIALPFIDSALSFLDSGMSLIGANDDAGFPHQAIILPNALTAGVDTFNYAFTSHVAGGTVLFETAEGAPFVAVSAVPEPSSKVLLLSVGILILLYRKIHGSRSGRKVTCG